MFTVPTTILNPTTLWFPDLNQVAILCCTIILLFIYKQQNVFKEEKFFKKLFHHHNIKPMPKPPAIPLIGHLHLLRDYQHNPWEGFNEIRKQFGNVVSLKMGIHQMALVSSSDGMREILLKKGEIFSNRPNFPRHHIIFGGDKENSLALCDWSNTHRDRRKLCKRGIVPNRFSSRNQLLEQIILKFVEEFNRIEIIERKKLIFDKTNNNFYYNITKKNLLFLTSDIFMEFLCKETHSHSSNDYREFVDGCDFVFWDINQCYLIDFIPNLTKLGLGFSYLKRLKNVTDFLRNYIDDKIFDPRLSKHSTSKQQSSFPSSSSFKVENNMFYENLSADNNNDHDNDDDDEDYLDSIIIEHLSDETSMSLADYKVGFADLLAGHAAVTNILMRLLGHLSLDQTIQDMICEEANQKKLHELNYKPSLPVTEAALQEALRLASSPIVPHVNREDTSVENFYIPQGTVVLFNNYHLNLSETLWTNPKEFNPRRFLKTCDNGEILLDIPKHFMPFSVGLRQCLGYKMVESTTIVAVANLCREFVIKANNEDLVRKLVAPKGSVALNPDAECFELKLYPRSK